MDQTSEYGEHKAGQGDGASWGARVSQYGLLIFVAPLYLAAGAGGEAVGAALMGQQGMLNLFPAAGAMYVLHRCFWD